MGKVWLVGAGPSDIGLFTIKGMEVLKQAEVVVYDRLVGDSILCLIPKEAEAIDVGKRAGNHTMPQKEINEMLLAKAREGKRVVRLKGGDPFLFGRGGEELELLAEYGIPYEIVPGVTSAIAVPAYNGIPVTHRDYASSVHIITGHKKQQEVLDIDFEALVRTGGTLVFLMGIGNLPKICEGLMRAGMRREMPAAVLQQGTTAGQKKVTATVGTLEKEVNRQGIETPAMIVVGKVCALGGQFEWYEKQPLFGNKILVTRPWERAGTLSSRLRELGAEVVEVPAIRTVPIAENERLTEAITNITRYKYLAFTSPSGVGVFFDALKEHKKDVRALRDMKIAAIGRGTAKELESRGILCDLMPEIYDGEHLGILLGETAKDEDAILIPRAFQGTPKLIEAIQERTGAKIDDIAVYDTVYADEEEFLPLKEQIVQGKFSMAVFTSASTVKGFARAFSDMEFDKIQAVCIGVQTARAAQDLGMKTITAQQASIDALIESCLSAAGIHRCVDRKLP